MENDNNFKSCQNMLTTLKPFYGIICYNFVLDTIYIGLHLHVIKDLSPLDRPKFSKQIDFLYPQINGGSEDTYVLSNCAYYNHNVSKF